MKFWIDVKDCNWEGDFDGEETGHEDVNVVGFYSWNNFLLEINSETREILYVGFSDNE